MTLARRLAALDITVLVTDNDAARRHVRLTHGGDPPAAARSHHHGSGDVAPCEVTTARCGEGRPGPPHTRILGTTVHRTGHTTEGQAHDDARRHPWHRSLGRLVGDEGGSVLIIALVMVFVIALIATAVLSYTGTSLDASRSRSPATARASTPPTARSTPRSGGSPTPRTTRSAGRARRARAPGMRPPRASSTSPHPAPSPRPTSTAPARTPARSQVTEGPGRTRRPTRC